MRKFLTVIAFLAITITINAQNVLIPDSSFKAVLIGDTLINTNQDNEIQLSEAVSFTGQIRANGSLISDVTGLEAFINITKFSCVNSGVIEIDLSKNVQLIKISLSNIKITTLDLSKNILLENVYCENTHITEIDVSHNSLLNNLQLSGNKLTRLDISTNEHITDLECDYNYNLSDLKLNTAIERLWCMTCDFSELHLTEAINLNELNCYDNDIQHLDLSKNTKLDDLNCGRNALTSLDISPCPNITRLNFSINQITTMDVSQNKRIQFFNCGNNELHTLNVANGNNPTFFYPNFIYNKLDCIQVDDQTYSEENWNKIDARTRFSTDCSEILSIDNDNEKILSIYPNPVSDNLHINTTSLSSYAVYSLTGNLLEEAEGSEAEIDLSDLPSGSYILQTTSESGIKTQRFTKQ